MSERFRLVVVGSSDHYPDDEIYKAIDRMVKRHPEGVVVYVKAHNGVSKAAWQQAAVLGVPYEIEPDLDEEVGAASALNSRLVAKADAVLAFFHPGPTADLSMTSSGTMNAVRQAAAAKVKVFVHHEGKWTEGVPQSPSLPPDGWKVPAGYRASSSRTSTCGNERRPGCGAEILWAENTRTGRLAPLNPDGTIHFTTCPVAIKQRRTGA